MRYLASFLFVLWLVALVGCSSSAKPTRVKALNLSVTSTRATTVSNTPVSATKTNDAPSKVVLSETPVPRTAPDGTRDSLPNGDVCPYGLSVIVSGGESYAPGDPGYETVTPYRCYANIATAVVDSWLHEGSPETAETCSETDRATAKAELEPLVTLYHDESTLAEATARIAISPVIGQLQDTKRKIDGLKLPQCAHVASIILSQSIEWRVEEFLHFADQMTNYVVNSYRRVADEYFGQDKLQLENIGIVTVS